MDRYSVILESQLGPRTGTLRLEDIDGALNGTLTLLGYENPVSGEWVGEHSLRLSHHLRTQVSELSCVSVFELEGDRITGTLINGQNIMKWHGEREESGKKGGNTDNGGK